MSCESEVQRICNLVNMGMTFNEVIELLADEEAYARAMINKEEGEEDAS